MNSCSNLSSRAELGTLLATRRMRKAWTPVFLLRKETASEAKASYPNCRQEREPRSALFNCLNTNIIICHPTASDAYKNIFPSLGLFTNRIRYLPLTIFIYSFSLLMPCVPFVNVALACACCRASIDKFNIYNRYILRLIHAIC